MSVKASRTSRSQRNTEMHRGEKASFHPGRLASVNYGQQRARRRQRIIDIVIHDHRRRPGRMDATDRNIQNAVGDPVSECRDDLLTFTISECPSRVSPVRHVTRFVIISVRQSAHSDE